MKVIVLLAEGFEIIEALTPVDYLRRGNADVKTLSLTENLAVKSSTDITVEADESLSSWLEKNEICDGLIIPGGLPGATNLRDDQRVIDLVKKFNENKKMLAAICAGPIVLDKAGVINDKKVTSFPSYEGKLSCREYSHDLVVRDENIISGRGAAASSLFAMEILDYLLDKESIKSVKEGTVFNLVNPE